MIYISLIHLFTFFSAAQESVAAAKFHSQWVPRWAHGRSLALWRQPGEPQPRESLHRPSAKPLCDGWDGPACVLDAVLWAVWAEDGLHPTRVQTGRSLPGSVSDCDWQDELRVSVRLLPRPPAEPGCLLTLWPHAAMLPEPVLRTCQCS